MDVSAYTAAMEALARVQMVPAVDIKAVASRLRQIGKRWRPGSGHGFSRRGPARGSSPPRLPAPGDDSPGCLVGPQLADSGVPATRGQDGRHRRQSELGPGLESNDGTNMALRLGWLAALGAFGLALARMGRLLSVEPGTRGWLPVLVAAAVVSCVVTDGGPGRRGQTVDDGSPQPGRRKPGGGEGGSGSTMAFGIIPTGATRRALAEPKSGWLSN